MNQDSNRSGNGSGNESGNGSMSFQSFESADNYNDSDEDEDTDADIDNDQSKSNSRTSSVLEMQSLTVDDAQNEMSNNLIDGQKDHPAITKGRKQKNNKNNNMNNMTDSANNVLNSQNFDHNNNNNNNDQNQSGIYAGPNNDANRNVHPNVIAMADMVSQINVKEVFDKIHSWYEYITSVFHSEKFRYILRNLSIFYGVFLCLLSFSEIVILTHNIKYEDGCGFVWVKLYFKAFLNAFFATYCFRQLEKLYRVYLGTHNIVCIARNILGMWITYSFIYRLNVHDDPCGRYWEHNVPKIWNIVYTESVIFSIEFWLQMILYVDMIYTSFVAFRIHLLVNRAAQNQNNQNGQNMQELSSVNRQNDNNV